MSNEGDMAELSEARLVSLSGDYAEALRLIDLYLIAHNNDVDALLLKGNTLELVAYAQTEDDDLSYENSEELTQAKTCFESILSQDPTHVNALFDLAGLYKAAKQNEKSLMLLQAAEALLMNDDPMNQEMLQSIRDDIAELTT